MKLIKQKKLKEMTIEEIKIDKRMYTFMAFLALALGIVITVQTALRNADLALGSLGFTLAITVLMLLNALVDSFELRIREALEKRV